MKKLSIVIISLFILFFGISRCKHDPQEIPIPKTNQIKDVEFNNLKDSICFEEEIRPILTTYCAISECHDTETSKDGINFSSFSETSKVNGATLLTVLDATGKKKMPPTKATQLPLTDKEALKKWINQGMKNNIDCPEICDSSKITFSKTIFPIFQSYCIGCHKLEKPMLNDYEQIKTQIDNGKIVCSISHESSCKPMPSADGKLSACKIELIKKWIANGTPNN